MGKAKGGSPVCLRVQFFASRADRTLHRRPGGSCKPEHVCDQQRQLRFPCTYCSIQENSLHTRKAIGYTVTKVDRLQVTTGSLSLPEDLQTPFLVHAKSFTLQPFRKINYGHDLALRPTRLSGLGL